jgi:WD40 repeat protein
MKRERSHSICRRWAIALAGFQLATVVSAAPLDFYRDIYPFLKANCISCHNKTTTKAGLNLETPELMRKGGDTGPGIVPGKGAKSLIVQAAMHTKDLEMPPKNNKSGAVNLTAAEIKVLKTWIDQGAKSSVQQERSVVWQPLAPAVDPIYSVAMTRDGRYAVCGRANEIFLYDLATRQFVTRLAENPSRPAHRGLVQSLAFSPDGTRLASSSYREVKIWRQEPGEAAVRQSAPATVKPKPELIIPPELKGVTNVSCLGRSKDGSRIVAGGDDGAVRVWESAEGKLVAELRGSVAISRQTAALDWTIAAQGVEQAFQKAEVTRMEAQNKALDELLKKANETIVAMKKLLPEKQKALLPTQAALTTARKAAEEAAAKVSEGKADAALDKTPKEALDKLAAATMAENSAQAAVDAANNNITDAEAEVKRITATKAKNVVDLAAANVAITAAKTKLDEATAELAKVKQGATAGQRKSVAVALSADAQRAAALFNDGHLIVWAVASGMPIEQVSGSPTLTGSVEIGLDGSCVALGADGTTRVTRPESRWVLERVLGGEQDRSLFADRVNAVRFSPDGKTLAAGGGEPSRSGDVTLFEVTTGKVLQNWKERHQDAVLSLDFSPDGRLLASGAADKIAKVNDVVSGQVVNLFEGHTHHVLGVAFRADGRMLATAGGDGAVLVWDMHLGERKKKIEGWSKEVTSLQYIGASSQIVTSAGDNLIRIINDTGSEVRAIAKLPDFMQSAASTATASVIIGGGEDSQLRVWDGTNGKELTTFGAR